MSSDDGTPFAFADFEAARDALLASIRSGDRYVLFTGESGAGKTTLLRAIKQQLDRGFARVVYFNLARLSPAGLVRVLARQLRVPPSRSQSETVQALVKVLHDEPVRTWLWIDEAQLLPDDTFAELRTLVEADLAGHAAVSVLLMGLPELRERLQAPRLFPIWRRLEGRVDITGLRADESAPFLAHLFGEAQASRFDRHALEVLFERSRGLPGLLALHARQILRAHPEGQLDGAQVDAGLQRWEIG